MPITLKADSIRERAEASFDGRVQKATTEKIARIDRVTNALIDALSAALDAHFARQEQAQASPYPHDQEGKLVLPSAYEMGAFIETPAFKSTPEQAEALTTPDERQEIWRRVELAFSEAGYSLQPANAKQAAGVAAFIRDHEFRP